MIVRFATRCDICDLRSTEYTAWPSCTECQRDICLACAVPGSLIETDGEQPATVICATCYADLIAPIDTSGYDYSGGGR